MVLGLLQIDGSPIAVRQRLVPISRPANLITLGTIIVYLASLWLESSCAWLVEVVHPFRPNRIQFGVGDIVLEMPFQFPQLLEAHLSGGIIGKDGVDASVVAIDGGHLHIDRRAK